MKYKITCADGRLHLNFKSLKEIAEFFEVTEGSVTSWITGRRKPKKKLYIEQIWVKGKMVVDLTGGCVSES